MKNLSDLPRSDNEFWDGEINVSPPTPVRSICTIHNKRDWISGEYVDNKDGSVSCANCSWGTNLPGGFRIANGKIVA